MKVTGGTEELETQNTMKVYLTVKVSLPTESVGITTTGLCRNLDNSTGT